MNGLSNEPEISNRIQNIILALRARIETVTVLLSGKDTLGRQVVDLEDVRKMFSKLYEAGIVIEKCLDNGEAVSHQFLTSKSPYSVCYFLACLGLWSMKLQNQTRTRKAIETIILGVRLTF